ncbi:MAG: Adenylate cyclase [Candidatus Ozemobacter sibiricus]|jgi:adenylate cyclase|uniref:Adenylate cyclase n=1 Tax=Candidatus Ozemobacter sibiricus TaxID=2268124 RepID=A0A367ZL16_9BACT|nr:MAG: Adenylate cyclase [Candidatus Ozemobacter sibiricus]
MLPFADEGKGDAVQGSWWRTLGLFLLLAVVLWIPVPPISSVEDFERWTLDQRFRWRGARPAPDDVVIVRIDFDQPWFRETPTFALSPWYGRFVRAMAEASASCVLFDLLFSSRRPDDFLLDHVTTVLASHGITLERAVLRDLSFDLPLRQALLEARARGLKVILGTQARSMVLNEALGGLAALIGPNHLGFFNIDTDPDQVVRSAYLYDIDPATGRAIPAVSLAMAGAVAGGFAVASGGQLLLGGRPVEHLIEGKRGLIDFLGGDGTFRQESFQQVLEDFASRPASLARFAGKTVLVGFTNTLDRKMVPTGFMYGVEIHAHLLANLRARRFLQAMPPAQAFALDLALAVLAAGVFVLGVKGAAVVTPLLVVGWVGAAVLLFGHGFVLPCARPLVMLIGGSLVEGYRRYRFLEREKGRLRQLFGRYVDDTVVETLLRLPHEHLLNGARRQICVMFADIRGFTSFAEQRDPAEVVRFLNTYFGGATQIIQKHHGVVDKFLGDGLMAFFNAPLERETFAADAVRAALELRELAASPAIRKAAGAFPIRVGIALHVGPAVVGNIGSERKIEFTAIGDTVNTASRLEALNKQYDTDIMASEEVVQAARGVCAWQELGVQAIRGKERQVRLFTPKLESAPATKGG